MSDRVLSTGEMVALHRDAARYRKLREMPPLDAQALFWNHSSRKDRDKAIDAYKLPERK